MVKRNIDSNVAIIAYSLKQYRLEELHLTEIVEISKKIESFFKSYDVEVDRNDIQRQLAGPVKEMLRLVSINLRDDE